VAPGALAAPPANDDFADRKPLTGDLPIEETGANVEATKEEGEFIPGLAPAGHSIWFEWEAQETGWITIGACDDAFPTILAIFTGTELEHLTPVVTGNASEGPDCPYSQRQYTFKAVNGAKYVIAVDGNIFHMPEAPMPVTEGQVVLQIEETPPPSNDDFAAATVFVGSLEEEFEGQAFYFGSKFGNNWNATEEVDEPDHIGGPHGASVWYSWTAPVSGEAKISAGFFSGIRMSVYRGSSLKSLELMFGGIGPAGGASFMAQAGTTYKIAIYGLLDESSGEPGMSSFQFNISMRVSVPAKPANQTSAAPLDTTPPNTTIRKRVLKRHPPGFVFSFSSNEPGSSFECKLDKHPFAKCGSSRTFRHPTPGLHLLKVRSIDQSGNVDQSPAIAIFHGRRKPNQHK
jgi:hypothetical protein